MLPVIALPGFVQIHTWGLLVFFAVLCVLWLGRVNAPARGLPPELIERSWPWLVSGGLLGAHLYYLLVIAGWPLRSLPAKEVFNVFSGTAVQGGILGGIAAAAVFLRLGGRPLLPFCDALSPAGALAQAISRLGCFAVGCCYGRRTSSFLGVVFTSPWADPATPRGIALHPAQLYESILDFGLAVFLQKELKRRAPPGRLFALYLMGASLIRFFVQFFRDDDSGHLLFGLAHSQFLAAALAAAGAGMYNKIMDESAIRGL